MTIWNREGIKVGDGFLNLTITSRFEACTTLTDKNGNALILTCPNGDQQGFWDEQSGST